MTSPTRPDDDLDDLGPDLDALAAHYHVALEGIEPPQHLDAQILAAAHRAADAKPRAPGAALVYPSSFARRMRVPFGLAATIVAVASITVALWKESPEKLTIPSDHAPITTSPKADSAHQATSSGAVAVTVMPARQVAPAPEISEAAPAPFIAPPPARRKTQEQSRALQSAHAPAPLAAPAVASSGKTQSDAKSSGAADETAARVTSKSERSLDRVTVTGSNLKRADTEIPSPVQVITLEPREPSSTSAASAPSGDAQRVAPPAPAPLAEVAASPAHDAVPATPAPAPIPVPPPAIAYSAPPPTPVNAPPVSAAPAAAIPAPAAPAAAAPAAAAPAPAAPAPAAPRLAARQVEPTPKITQPAPNMAAAPSTEAASLLAALQTAADAGDTVAANFVLDALKNNYPHVQISAALRVQLMRLGIAVPQAR